MTINTAVNGSAMKVEIVGRLDTITAPELEAELSEHEDVSDVTFDFSGLEYISSAGLRVLLAEQKAINSRSGKMVLKNVNDTIMEVFEITGFIDILTIE
ncbi:MAG: STAS domain-containing protein [Eubacteriales bacterium]|nr:STAS domain-containing protein [Eubacteriales bacterium]